MKRLLIKNIWKLVSCDAEDRVYQNVNLYCENGLIRAIGTIIPEADEIVDGSNMIVYPGLVNAHHHLYQVFTRNLLQVQNLELFAWLRTLYEFWKKLDSEVIYNTTLVGSGELMKNGCTTVFDHHYIFPNCTDDFLGVQIEAGRKLGIRMHLSRGSMDLSQKDGGLPPDSVVQSVDEIMRDSQDAIQRFHDATFQSMCRIALAPCSPFSVSEELLRQSAILAREYKVRLHTHLCETKDEEKYMIERVGMRPLAYMHRLGWTGNDVWYAHGIHLNDEELNLLKETGTGVCHCPISNMKLSSGIARIPDMLELKIPVGLGVDGSASNDGSNMMEELRVAYLLHRLNSTYRAPTGYDILKMATIGSARLLGREQEIGSLEVGKCADFFMVNTNCLEMVAACEDVQSVLATVGLKGGVDYTFVNGEMTVKNKKLVNVDEGKIISSANRKFHTFITTKQ